MPIPAGHCGQLTSAPRTGPRSRRLRQLGHLDGGDGLVGAGVAAGRSGRRWTSSGRGDAEGLAARLGLLRLGLQRRLARRSRPGRGGAAARRPALRIALLDRAGCLGSETRGCAAGLAADPRWTLNRRMSLSTPTTVPAAAPDTVGVSTGPLSFEDVVAVARGGAPVALSDDALAAIDRARAVVEELAAAPTPAYGISTGFGALATRHIPTEMRAQLQRSLVRSHAAGSGPEVEREVVRGTDAAAALDAGDRPDRRTAGDGGADRRRCSTPASRRWCTSTARSAAPATSRRSRTARWR